MAKTGSITCGGATYLAAWLSILAGVLVSSIPAFAQDDRVAHPDTACVQLDLADVIRASLNKPAKMKPEQTGSLLLLPIIGSNPATGFMFGVGGQYAFRMPESTRYSSLSGSIQYTTQSQFIFMLKNNVFSRRNRFFHTGDWRYLIFSQSTYGLGTNAPEGGVLDYQYNLGGIETTSDSLTQPMKFNFARLHQTMGFQVSPGVYLGLGYQFDGYYEIKDEKLRLNPGDTLITSHYGYSTYYGFDLGKYYSSAINARVVIDKRDNMINAQKGYYMSLGWRGALRFIGNKNNSSLFQIEWRSFHNVSRRSPSHLVAFWLMGDFSGEGDIPYLILPATAYDQRGRSARGYTQGRFRGNNMLYGEAEYRFPISKCTGVLGGVLFVNATTASHPYLDPKLFQSVKPGYGFGLRIMADKTSRTNITVDIGFGEKSSGFYLAVSETF